MLHSLEALEMKTHRAGGAIKRHHLGHLPIQQNCPKTSPTKRITRTQSGRPLSIQSLVHTWATNLEYIWNQIEQYSQSFYLEHMHIGK